MAPSIRLNPSPVNKNTVKRPIEENMIIPSRFSHEGRTLTPRKATTTPKIKVI